MTAKPYTDADVELVAIAIYLNDWPDATTNGWLESAMSAEYRQNARAALESLAAAGRLLPTDARTAIEEALSAAERARWGDVPDRMAIAEWADEIHRRLTRGEPA